MKKKKIQEIFTKSCTYILHAFLNIKHMHYADIISSDQRWATHNFKTTELSGTAHKWISKSATNIFGLKQIFVKHYTHATQINNLKLPFLWNKLKKKNT